jgi:hypothetical protein
MEVQQAINLIESQCEIDGQELPRCRRFPIKVTLNHFARVLASTSADRRTSLIGYIAERIHQRTDMDVRVEDLRLWLKGYPWLLILDGLDEVPSASNRDEVLTAIQEFWVDASECQADILVLATTRPQGYDDDFSPKFYSHRYLTPLPSERALTYGQKLAHARYGNDPDREQRIITRLRRAVAEDSTSRLMRSPLQVTIMATLVDQTGQPPHERWRLFHDYYEVIYRREMERDIPAAELLRDHKSNIDEIHHRVGLVLQIESERRGLTDAHLTTQQFASVVEARLSAEGYVDTDLERLREVIIEAAANRLVFLVGVEAGQIGFEIRSLQEFMAAQALMNGSDQTVSERMNAIAPVSHWRNVFLFCAGRCFAVDQHRRDTVLSICLTQNESEDDPLLRESLAGSQLALEVMADGAAHRQPRFERSFARAALRLLDRAGTEPQLALAEVYQPTMREAYTEEIEKRLDLLSPGISANAWLLLLTLGGAGVSWASALAETKWPPRDDVRCSFFSAEHYSMRRFRGSEWYWDKITELIEYESFSDLWPLRFQADTAELGKKARRRLAAAGLFDKGVEIPFRLAKSGTPLSLSVTGAEQTGSGRSGVESSEIDGPIWLVATDGFRRNPNAKTLAETLRKLSAVFTRNSWRNLTTATPWPLGACVAASGTEADLLRLAEAAERGDLGQKDDWQLAEERWSRGITLEDIVAFDQNKCQIGNYLTHRGFPIPCAQIIRIFGGSREGESSYDELFGCLGTIGSDLIRRQIAAWFLEAATMDAVNGRLHWLSLESLKRATLVAANREWFGLNVISALSKHDRTMPDTIELLDFVGRSKRLWVSTEADPAPAYQAAWQGLNQDASRLGLRQVAAVCSPHVDILPISPEMLSAVTDNNPFVQGATLLLSLIHKCSAETEARVLGSQFAEAAQSEGMQHLVFSAIQLVSKGKVPLRLGTHFLVALSSGLTSHWQNRSAVASGIDDLIRRRRLTLGDPTTQRQLGLTGESGSPV